MYKLILLFLIIHFSVPVKSQNIYSALRLNAEREYKTKRPKKIVETNTFFNTSGKKVDKNIKTFDNTGMLLTEERYDNGVLKARLTYTNDTIRRIIMSRVFEIWQEFGYSKETAFYTYDQNFFLIGTTDKDADRNIIRQANITCNEKGHPIELSLFDGKGLSFGKETASYFYDKNKVVTSVISNDNKVLTSDTTKISFTEAGKFPEPNDVYNTNGDLTNWVRQNRNGTETIFEAEYSYDSFGNCTENKIFKVIVKKNGQRKREHDRIFSKEYFY